MQLASLTCRLVGARCRVLGIVPVDDALDSLADDATTVSVNASYLAELVVASGRATEIEALYADALAR